MIMDHVELHAWRISCTLPTKVWSQKIFLDTAYQAAYRLADNTGALDLCKNLWDKFQRYISNFYQRMKDGYQAAQGNKLDMVKRICKEIGDDIYYIGQQIGKFFENIISKCKEFWVWLKNKFGLSLKTDNKGNVSISTDNPVLASSVAACGIQVGSNIGNNNNNNNNNNNDVSNQVKTFSIMSILGAVGSVIWKGLCYIELFFMLSFKTIRNEILKYFISVVGLIKYWDKEIRKWYQNRKG